MLLLVFERGREAITLRLRVPVAGGRVHGRRIDFRYALSV